MKTKQAYILVVHTQYWKDYTSYYIMESNGRAMIRITQTGNEFEFSDLFVDEKYRGRGLGDYMLDYAINFSKRLTTHGTITISTNEYSADFCDDWYQKIGFKLNHMETPINLDVDVQDLVWNKVYKIVF